MFKKKLKKKLLPVAVLSTVAFSGLIGDFSHVSAEDSVNKKATNNGEIKNVIVLIGDGMGVSYTSAHRYLKDDPSTKVVESTTFDQYLVGKQTTYPDDP